AASPSSSAPDRSSFRSCSWPSSSGSPTWLRPGTRRRPTRRSRARGRLRRAPSPTRSTACSRRSSQRASRVAGKRTLVASTTVLLRNRYNLCKHE
ncbi:unnamed protein product, partial [Musa acuminata subsp. burmannicoides]